LILSALFVDQTLKLQLDHSAINQDLASGKAPHQKTKGKQQRRGSTFICSSLAPEPFIHLNGRARTYNSVADQHRLFQKPKNTAFFILFR